MAVDWAKRKRGMREYARKHDIDIPDGFKASVNGCGEPCKKLIRRIKVNAGLRVNVRWTAAMQDLIFPPSFGEMVVRVAKEELARGVKEDPPGSNSSPRIDMYLTHSGIPTSLPAKSKAWCAVFRRWVEDEAARRLGKKLKWFTNPAWVPNIIAAVKKGKLYREVKFEDAKGGDVVCLWNGGHVETVLYRKGSYLYCIGGNTKPFGQYSNGGEVALTKRHRSEVDIIGRRRF